MTEIGCSYTRDLKILPSMCDEESKLSIPAALDLFQDTATLHADNFDIGPEGMERRNSFWIITRTRIHINRMPSMMSDVSSDTWIQAPDRVSCERDYSIRSGEELLIYGRSTWAVIDRKTGRFVRMTDLYPELDFDKVPPDDKPFAKIGRNFDDADELGEYMVRSVDIDLGGHMNNVNYVRAMLGCFSTEAIKEMGITEVEVQFLSQTYEGETISFRCRKAEDGLEIGAIGREGKAVFLAKIV